MFLPLQLEEELEVDSPEGSLEVDNSLEADDSLEAEFEAARAKVSDTPASLSSLFEDDEVVEVDATVADETLLVSSPPKGADSRIARLGTCFHVLPRWYGSAALQVCAACTAELLHVAELLAQGDAAFAITFP